MSFSSAIRFTETFYLPTFSASDNAQTIEDELMSLRGMKRVTIVQAAKRLVCSYGAPLTLAAIKTKIEAMGYVVAPSLATY